MLKCKNSIDTGEFLGNSLLFCIHSEAEYAFQLRKSIVPLMMEREYQPDGWLGFVVGAKFWIDFTDKLQFKNDVNKLVREVGDRGKIDSEVIQPIDAVDVGGEKMFIYNLLWYQ